MLGFFEMKRKTVTALTAAVTANFAALSCTFYLSKISNRPGRARTPARATPALRSSALAGLSPPPTTSRPMFALTHSAAALRPAANKSAKRASVDTTVRAATTWTLDGRGCAGARTGDTGSLKNNIVAYKRRPAAESCPIKPIALSELCEERDGKFRMLDAVFEQEGDSLYVYGLKYDGTQTVEKACTVDGWPVPATSWSRFKLRPGQVVELNGEKFTVFRNVVAHA